MGLAGNSGQAYPGRHPDTGHPAGHRRLFHCAVRLAAIGDLEMAKQKNKAVSQTKHLNNSSINHSLLFTLNK